MTTVAAVASATTPTIGEGVRPVTRFLERTLL
jgi:hypothetical protein